MTPKKRFILDENLLICAQRGINDFNEKDSTCADLVNSMIRICHTMVVDHGLYIKYHHQLDAPRNQPIGIGPQFLSVFRAAMQIDGKVDDLARPNAPSFPEETSIPQGSQDDLAVTVRLAVETGAILVTTDAPLIQDLESSGIRAKNGLEVLTPQQALGRLDG